MRILRPLVAVVAMVLAAAPATVGVATAQPPPPRERTSVVDVRTPTQADRARLQGLDLDLTEHADADSVEVILYGQADERRLRDAGFAFDVRIADLAARDEANRVADERYAAATVTSALPSGRDSYRRLADYERELTELASAYPTLVKPITLNNPTWEGRQVRGIEITRDAAAQDGKPVFVMLGAHHAREWPSAEHTMEFGYDLLRNYGTDARTTRLVDTTRTIIVPVVNPDGFQVSREARTGPPNQDFSAHDFEMKRKNCRDAVGRCDRQTRLSGVDPNRNYGGLWGGAGASLSTPSDTYRGPGPFSEPETQNIRELVASRQVVTLISNHTYSNLILRPPGVLDFGFPLEEPQLQELGARMASRNGYANIPGFGLYDTTGGTEDWTFWSAGGLGYTFEIGPSEFHPPFETGVVAEYMGLAPAAGAGRGGNRAAYYDMLEATADTALHAVLTGTAPAGATLSLRKTFLTSTSPICQDNFCAVVGAPQQFEDTLSSTMTPSARSFTWHVNPSTRPVSAGRFGRDVIGPVQADIPMVNDPAVVPQENVSYPGPAPRLTVPFETFPFTVEGPPAADNGRLTVHIEWADPANDWDVYVLDASGAIVAQSASFGDATEDASMVDPPPGDYTAVVVNYDQVSRQLDDWSGAVRFASPTPTTVGAQEAWTFTCTSGSTVTTREVIVERGQSLDLGNACRRAK